MRLDPHITVSSWTFTQDRYRGRRSMLQRAVTSTVASAKRSQLNSFLPKLPRSFPDETLNAGGHRIRSFHLSYAMSKVQQDHSERYAFPLPPVPSLPIVQRDVSTMMSNISHSSGTTSPALLFPIRRVYCVGKNYEDHVKEMGGDIQRSKPVFFTKPNDGVVLAESSTGQEQDNLIVTPTPIRYPPNTSNLHYECELVVAIGKSSENAIRMVDDMPKHRIIPTESAADYIYGFAVGIDLTRRDLQQDAKDRRAPWDIAKQFDQCAPMGPITKMSLSELQEMSSSLHMELQVNGVIQQSTKPLQEMIWSIPEIISELSRSFTLQPGDLIMTGTPCGVGPVAKRDRIIGRVSSLVWRNFIVQQAFYQNSHWFSSSNACRVHTT